jgi:hypothetical protein
VSKAFEEARGRIKDSLAAKIHEAVFKQLDIEGPVGVPLSSTYRKEQETAYSQNPESSPIFRQLAFLKYGVTFRELIHRIDIEKSPVAQRHLMAVHRDYWRIQSGIRFEDLKLKFGFKHFQIPTNGLDFGLDKLTADELADCLNEICPCQQRHSTEYLKKLRIRMKQACSRFI